MAKIFELSNRKLLLFLLLSISILLLYAYQTFMDTENLPVFHMDSELLLNALPDANEANSTNTGDYSPLFLVALVQTHPGHADLRNFIRKTWANFTFPDLEIFVRFIVGRTTSDPNLTEAILTEQSLNNDIILGPFEDTYRNLVNKTMFSLRVASENYSQADYVLKIDDDVVVNIFNLVDFYRNTIGSRRLKKQFLCHVWRNTAVSRDKKNKYYVSPKEYKSNVFPPYCSGPAYIMTGDLPAALYEKAAGMKAFWLEDVFHTGMVPAAVGNIRFYPMQGSHWFYRHHIKKNVARGKGIFGHDMDGIDMRERWNMWNEILQLHTSNH